MVRQKAGLCVVVVMVLLTSACAGTGQRGGDTTSTEQFLNNALQTYGVVGGAGAVREAPVSGSGDVGV